jgi:hypothetical protein
VRRVLIILLLLAGCEKPPPLEQVDPSQIAIGPHINVRTDTVGHDEFEKQSTFALVDATNTGDRPAHVTLGGVLVDGDGHELGTLRAESLWIPPRGRRTFALVDAADQVRPGATTARIDLRGATRPRHDEPIKVEQGHVWSDQGRVVATGMVVNTADRPCHAVVLAAFHDATGLPMSRMFSVFPIGAKIERPTRFVGPVGSTTGQIYIGQIRC